MFGSDINMFITMKVISKKEEIIRLENGSELMDAVFAVGTISHDIF